MIWTVFLRCLFVRQAIVLMFILFFYCGYSALAIEYSRAVWMYLNGDGDMIFGRILLCLYRFGLLFPAEVRRDFGPCWGGFFWDALWRLHRPLSGLLPFWCVIFSAFCINCCASHFGTPAAQCARFLCGMGCFHMWFLPCLHVFGALLARFPFCLPMFFLFRFG